MKRYKVTVHVVTPYSTIVEGKNEEEAKSIALNREAPAEIDHSVDMETEWALDVLFEFPNLGKYEIPEIEEL